MGDWRKEIDKRFYDTVFAEVGGAPPEEVSAVAGAFFRQLENGKPYESMLNSSSAYKGKSKQYKLASQGAMNSYEQKIYNRNTALILDEMFSSNGGYKTPPPWTHFENVKAFGEPYWAKDFPTSVDIGRQRFYSKEKENA